MGTHDGGTGCYDNLYRGPGRVWSGKTNAGLDAAVAAAGWDRSTTRTRTPVPRALDIGCGEGADAVFLAQLGFDTTACDPVEEAVVRTRQSAAAAGVRLTTVVAGIDGIGATGPGFDVVTSFFVPLKKSRGDISTLDLLVAPGGCLIVAHHSNPSRQLEKNRITAADFVDPVEAEQQFTTGGWQLVAARTVQPDHHGHHHSRNDNGCDSSIPGGAVIRVLRKPARTP